MRRFTPLMIAAVAWIMVTASTGCAPTTSPTPTATSVDLTAPGTAASMVEDLMAAAGSTRVISVELTPSEAQLAVATGQKAVTYAWRDGVISTVESDIDYVGQAIFDPRTFALNDLGDLFRQSAAEVGSAQGQKLQIVDYDDGRIYMSVTTNPETRPVFFTTDGRLVQWFDVTDTASLEPVLADVLADKGEVVRVGVDTDGSVYADVPAGANRTLRTTRAPQFPLRARLRSETNYPATFSPEVVDAATITTVARRASRHVGKPLDAGFTLSIERPGQSEDPVAVVTIGGKTTRLTLTGVVLTK